MIEEWTLEMHRRAPVHQQKAMVAWLDEADLTKEKVISVRFVQHGEVELTMHEHGEDGRVIVTGTGDDAHIRHVGEFVHVEHDPPFIHWEGPADGAN